MRDLELVQIPSVRVLSVVYIWWTFANDGDRPRYAAVMLSFHQILMLPAQQRTVKASG